MNSNDNERPVGELRRAREIPELAFNGHRVDVRGWRVFSRDAELVGSIDSLFVEMRTRAVRYLGVALSDPNTKRPLGTVLVPVGAAARPGERHVVVLRSLTSLQLESAPRIRNRPITRADEDATLAAYGMATLRDVPAAERYTGQEFSEQRLFW